MSIDKIEPPEWFWKLIESTHPRLAHLESWLEKASINQIREFSAWYEIAAQELCSYSDGPIGYSEDNTEDVCIWIVGQGYKLWNLVVSDEIAFAYVALLIEEDRTQELPVPIIEWHYDVINPTHRGSQDPAYIASSVFWSRCGYEIYDAEQDRLMEKLIEG